MLEDVKLSLRISGNDLNIEILDLISSAKADLILSGVNSEKLKDTDPLAKRAVILYCKAHFGYEDIKMSERLEQSYISLKQHLSLSEEYTKVTV